MVNSIKGVLDTLSRPSPAFQKMKRELEDMLSSLRAEEIKHQAAEEEEQQQAYTAAELLSKLRTSLDNITETQAGISKEWMPLRENLSGIHTNVKLVADASASIENLIEHVNTVSQQLKDAEGYHQDITMLRQELSSAAYQVSDEIQISMDALKLLDTRAEQIQLQVNAMESTQQELQQVVADTEAHVTEFANRANLFAENIETLGQRISESVSAIDSATLAVENASQDGIRHLDSIRSRVDSFISNAKHSSTRSNRKNLK